MTISEEDITWHLNFLLEQADPGDSLHHLIVMADEAVGERGPLGLPAGPKLAVSFHAIAANNPNETLELFVAKVIATAAIDHATNNKKVLFAALSQEVWMVEDPDEATRKLLDSGELRVSDHPDAQEATVVYGACRDGRRWRSRRWVTGPKAGQTGDVDILVGPVRGPEFFGHSAGMLLRRMVGQRQ